MGDQAASHQPSASEPVGDVPIAGIILASGLSRRFGGANKLLVPIAGVPLVRRVAEAFVGARLRPVLVVLGHESESVLAVLAGLPVQVVDNPAYLAGQSRALRAGVGALPGGVRGAVIGVADQPYLDVPMIEQLVTTFRTGSKPLVVPRYAGRRGNPVVFAASLFPELLAVDGDQGGRVVLASHSDEITWVDVSDPDPGLDIDTVEDYRSLPGGEP